MVGRKIPSFDFFSISALCEGCGLVYLSHCFIMAAGDCVTRVSLLVHPCAYGVSRSVFNFLSVWGLSSSLIGTCQCLVVWGPALLGWHNVLFPPYLQQCASLLLQLPLYLVCVRCSCCYFRVWHVLLLVRPVQLRITDVCLGSQWPVVLLHFFVNWSLAGRVLQYVFGKTDLHYIRSLLRSARWGVLLCCGTLRDSFPVLLIFWCCLGVLGSLLYYVSSCVGCL